MNSIELAGTLTVDPTLKYTPGGLAILELNIGGTDHVIGDDGQARDLAWYHRASVFGTFAESLADGLHADDAVYIVGRLNYRAWETDDGQKRSAIDVAADVVRYLGQPPEEALDRDARGQARLKNATNRVLLVGNATRDAELRYTTNGHAVTSVGMAVNEKYKSKGQDQERTTFVDVTAWRDLAERNAEVKKGAGLVAVGRLVTDSFEDRDGNRRYKTKVEAGSLFETFKAGGQARATANEALDIDDSDDSGLPF